MDSILYNGFIDKIFYHDYFNYTHHNTTAPKHEDPPAEVPTNTLEYYMYYILTLVVGYVLINLLILFLKNSNEKQDLINVTFDYFGKQNKEQVVHDALDADQKSLRLKYLLASTLVKSATWVKAPYIFALYNRLHKFNREEIGVLYSIDNLASLLLGPLIGSLNDILGRKKFCVGYCFLVICHIALRLTGSRELAYAAQIISGTCSILIDTSFESWLNFEANRYFSNDKEGQMEKNSFLREVFTKQVQLDCFCSILLTGVATWMYMKYDIFYPFYLCQVLAFLAGVYICLSWNENIIDKRIMDGEIDKIRPGFVGTFKYSLERITSDFPLLYVGIIESCFKITLHMFLFIWTPLLEETCHGMIHPGAIFITFMLARLIGSELFEMSKLVLRTNSYIITIFISISSAASFWFSYVYLSFDLRLIMFIYFDGISGIFLPLMSTLKSQLIPENLRTTIMTFFRIPINVFTIASLYLTKYLTTYQICIIAFIFLALSSVINVLLLISYDPPDASKRKVVRSTKLKSRKNVLDYKE